MWWIDVALSLLIGLGVPCVDAVSFTRLCSSKLFFPPQRNRFILFTQHDQEFSSINPVWLLPVVAPNVAAASGALVASVLPEVRTSI